MEYQYAIVIGRFQPYHHAHHHLLSLALSRAAHVIVALGSHRAAPNIRNPWPTEQREQMIRACFDAPTQERLHFVAIRDYLYNDNLWTADLQAKVASVAGDQKQIALVGHRKDNTTTYLDAFPQWAFAEYAKRESIDATTIREAFLRGDAGWRKSVPAPVAAWLDAFAATPQFTALVEEQQFIDQYRKDWAAAPYPPVFVTVDAVVAKSGHILIVRRKGYPGKGQFALPGGFVKSTETLERGALRELREETGLVIPIPELRKTIQATGTFDHPLRSLRGRTITHGFYFNLGPVGELPAVKGGDDADKAWWMPLNDIYLNEDRFFEDHVSIITHFVNRF